MYKKTAGIGLRWKVIDRWLKQRETAKEAT